MAVGISACHLLGAHLDSVRELALGLPEGMNHPINTGTQEAEAVALALTQLHTGHRVEITRGHALCGELKFGQWRGDLVGDTTALPGDKGNDDQGDQTPLQEKQAQRPVCDVVRDRNLDHERQRDVLTNGHRDAGLQPIIDLRRRRCG